MKNNIDIHQIKHVENAEEFKQMLSFFIEQEEENNRYQLYREYANFHSCSTEEAKSHILKNLFSHYIKSSLKSALKLAQDDDKEAYSIINELEELKPIFKHHDINTFSSFIASIDKNLSITNSELLFNNSYSSDEFLSSVTNNLIKAISSPVNKPKDLSGFLKAFNNHPLLSCLQQNSELDKIIENIDSGRLDVGNYKQLIRMVLDIKNEANDEAIDFFISFLIKEDITKGIFDIYKNEEYEPAILKDLLHEIVCGREIDKKLLDSAITKVAEKRMTIATDANGHLNYANHSHKTLNDSGFKFVLNNEQFFFHFHTAQGKGENQNGQQATTLNVFNQHGINSVSCTFVKNNLGKNEESRDFCKEYKIYLTEKEKILFSNLQFEADMLETLYGTFEDHDLSQTHYLSTNFRIIKDSVSESMAYNQLHHDKSDLSLLKEKSQLYISFLNKYSDKLLEVKKTTDSKMSIQSQLVIVPILNIIKYSLNLEERVGELFNLSDIEIIQKFIEEKSTSTIVNSLQQDIKKSLKHSSHNRTLGNTSQNVFLDILNGKAIEKVTVIEKNDNKKTIAQIKKKILNKSQDHEYVKLILKKLKKGDIYFTEGDYTNSTSKTNAVDKENDQASYYIASRMRSKSSNNKNKTEKTYSKHLEILNLLCEYGKLHGTKIFSGKQSYENGFKPQ